MKIKSLNIFAVALFALIMIGCGPVKLYNVENKIIEGANKEVLKRAIFDAGYSLGWNMREENSNTIIGTLVRKKFSATANPQFTGYYDVKISITYNENSYSIKLLEANNLDYNPTEETIRSGYNGWIINLENQIDGIATPLMMTESLKKKELEAQADKKNKSTTDNGLREIYDVINAPISKGHSIEAIEKAIFTSGKQNNWLMKKQKEGFILAKKVIRKHTMVVRISYDQAHFSINYITSENLKYQGYYIHRNYNVWIQQLEQGINFNL